MFILLVWIGHARRFLMDDGNLTRVCYQFVIHCLHYFGVKRQHASHLQHYGTSASYYLLIYYCITSVNRQCSVSPNLVIFLSVISLALNTTSCSTTTTRIKRHLVTTPRNTRKPKSSKSRGVARTRNLTTRVRDIASFATTVKWRIKKAGNTVVSRILVTTTDDTGN